jgi:hypothetical protein
MRGKRTIPGITADTTSAIWTTLQPLFMPPANESKWKFITERYLDFWNLPNCIGAKHGKHIRTKCSPKTASLYFNYEGYFSVILLPCADADVHVEDFGKNSDGYVFRASTLGEILENKELDIPLLSRDL